MKRPTDGPEEAGQHVGADEDISQGARLSLLAARPSSFYLAGWRSAKRRALENPASLGAVCMHAIRYEIV